jgi:hypothetical protein
MNDRFVLCINNKEYLASLELFKIYKVLDDKISEEKHYLRIIDESGEDYLYPQQNFFSISLPDEAIGIYDKEMQPA